MVLNIKDPRLNPKIWASLWIPNFFIPTSLRTFFFLKASLIGVKVAGDTGVGGQGESH